MKTASVRDVQHNLNEVLSWLSQGEEVQVVRRKKVVARLLPPLPETAVASPDFVGRAQAIWGKKPRGKALSSLVLDSRGAY